MSKDVGKHRELEERLVTTEELQAQDIPELLSLFADKSLTWSDSTRRLRSAALLLTYVTRASRSCSEEFLALGGMALLGEVLCEAVSSLENSVGLLRDCDFQEDTGMRALACLRCLHSLPLTEASIPEDINSSLLRLQVLHPTAASEDARLGGIADLSKSARELCHQWQCKSGHMTATTTTPGGGNLRSKAAELIAQGFLGAIEGHAVAAKVEVALFSLYNGATPAYKSHARMLKSNLSLPGNAELRSRLLSGSLAVEQLVAMDSTALAPEALQQERRAEQEKAFRETVISERPEPPVRSDGELGDAKPSPSRRR